MGATSQRPTSGAPGAGGSGFYQNALNQQKQAVANVPAIQAAQSQSGTAPNRPGTSNIPSPQGQQSTFQPEDTRYLDAYNNYMQQHGGSQYPPVTGSPFGQSQPQAPQPQQVQAPQPQQPSAPGQPRGPMNRRRPMGQEQPPSSPKGITMGAGYANRPFG
jgi:hypothetical protein